MISLAGRDILNSWVKFIFTGIGLGLLIGVTLTMAGLYRGMVDDATRLLNNSRADLLVVQKDTLGPYAEASSIYDDIWRSIEVMKGVSQAVNVTYLTMQVQHEGHDIRAMVSGITSGNTDKAGWPPYLIAGRHITKNHYEAVVDIKTGFGLNDVIKIRRNDYKVVGITSRMVSSSGDPIIFIPLKDAQDIQFLKDNDAIWQQRRRTTENPDFNIPNIPKILNSVIASQDTNSFVNAILVQVKAGYDPEIIAHNIERWKRLKVYNKTEMREILVGKLIANAAKQIAIFLIILAIVGVAIIAFIIYTLTLGKIREIAVLKLIGTKDRTIISMILQQAIALGVLGFVVGKIAATFATPYFPKHILLTPIDSIMGFLIIIIICIISSVVSIYTALKINPAEALGG